MLGCTSAGSNRTKLPRVLLPARRFRDACRRCSELSQSPRLSRYRFVLKATVFPSKGSSGFVGYGDADPSNVSPRVRGAEMRVAETRAVNRALPTIRAGITQRIDGFNMDTAASLAARQPQRSRVRYVPVAVNDLELARLKGKLEFSRDGGEKINGTG